MALGAAYPTSTSRAATSPGSKGAARRFVAGQSAPQGQTATNPYNIQAAQIGAAVQDARYQADRANAFLPVVGANYDRQMANARTNADLEAQRIGLNEAALGIDRGANARDRDYYTNLLGINTERGTIAQESFNNQVAQLQAAYDQGVRGANSQATASGSWLGSGRGQAIVDERTKMTQGQEAANLQRRSQLQGLAADRLGLEKQRAETSDRDAKLDQVAASYGLDRQKLQTNLEQGLADLGWDKFIKLDELISKASSPYASVSGPAQQAIEQAMQTAAVFGGGAMGDFYKSRFGG